MTSPWRQREVCHALNPQLSPNMPKVIPLIELYFVRYQTSTIQLVGSIMQVPSCLRLLHEQSNNITLVLMGVGTIFSDDPPYLQILACIAIFIFGRSLPSDNESPERRKA